MTSEFLKILGYDSAFVVVRSVDVSVWCGAPQCDRDR